MTICVNKKNEKQVLSNLKFNQIFETSTITEIQIFVFLKSVKLTFFFFYCILTVMLKT